MQVDFQELVCKKSLIFSKQSNGKYLLSYRNTNLDLKNIGLVNNIFVNGYILYLYMNMIANESIAAPDYITNNVYY